MCVWKLSHTCTDFDPPSLPFPLVQSFSYRIELDVELVEELEGGHHPTSVVVNGAGAVLPLVLMRPVPIIALRPEVPTAREKGGREGIVGL